MKKIYIVLIACITISVNTVAQIPSYISTNGLVGFWPFNGNSNDESGNGNNGTIYQAVSTLDRNSINNSAYYFDGTDDYIDIPNSNTISVSQNITINVWINHVSSTALNEYVIAKGQGSNGFGSHSYGFEVENNFAGFYLGTGTNNDQYCNFGTIPSFTWCMLTGTYDGSVMKTYLNGQLIQQTSYTGGIHQTADGLGIGGEAGWPFQINRYYNGDIDDVAIWNRALSQNEITKIYNECPSTITNQPINITANLNSNVQFTVGTNPSIPNIQFQWQTDIGFGFQNISNVGQYSGSTTNALSISSVSQSNNNQAFRCITNSLLCASDTTNTVVLSIGSVGINEVKKSNTSIYPNPANDILNIKSNSNVDRIEIINSFGQVVYIGNLTNQEIIINSSKYQDGVYYVNLLGDNLVIRDKFIIHH